MIAKLRRRHRGAWALLAFVLAATLIAAWSARRPALVMERLPEALLQPATP